jgi:hypothetical protein
MDEKSTKEILEKKKNTTEIAEMKHSISQIINTVDSIISRQEKEE